MFDPLTYVQFKYRCSPSSYLDLSTFHTGLGHASSPCTLPPGAATACVTYLCEWWGVLRTQATSSAIPTNAAPTTHGNG